jgi:peptide/nickel transport system permease protein
VSAASIMPFLRGPRIPRAWLPGARAGVYLAILVLAIVLVAAVHPHLLARQDPYDIDPTNAFSPPSMAHWFGTDQNGRDTFARVVYGTGSSLLVGVAAIVIALLLGIILGIGGTLTGRWGDVAARRLIEVLYAFPPLVLALVCIALLGPSAETLAVAVGFGGAAGYARIIRARALVVTQSDYVFAARALGHPLSRILLRTMLPNIARPLLPLLTLGVAQSIVWATGLSFLGLGVQPPSSEWGAMLSDSRNYTAMAWWLTVFPGATIAITALSLTAVGRYLQSRLDVAQSA